MPVVEQVYRGRKQPGNAGEKSIITKEERYTVIAATMRKQRFPDFPLKHEWVELLTRLCRYDDRDLREIGITELSTCAERSNRDNWH